MGMRDGMKSEDSRVTVESLIFLSYVKSMSDIRIHFSVLAEQ